MIAHVKTVAGRYVPRRLLAGLALLALAACSSTGGPFGLSQAQEQAIGEQQHPQILAAFGGEVDDPQLRAYVQRIFDRLVAASAQPEAQLKLTILDSPVVNAMALPGHVYVTRGLLALANNEAELAGVLGHEIGHVFQRHTAKRVSRGNLAGLGAVAVAILTRDASAAQAAGQAAQLYVLSYSRGQEFEADTVGVALLARADYDPIAEADFLNTLGRWSALQAQIAGRTEAPPEYLSTHPNSAERVRRAAAEANVLRQAEAAAADRNRSAYLNAIDGIVYGEDPVAQGFVRGRDFIHPGIGFAFTVPRGFELQNAAQSVVARADSGAQMQFTGVDSQMGPVALIDGPLSQSLNVDLSPARPVTINGRPAAVGQARADTRQGPVDVTAYAVQWNGAERWIFLWVTPTSETRRLDDAIRRSVESLRPVDARSANAPAAKHVDVVTVQPGDTAAGLAQEMAFPGHQEALFRVLSAIENDEDLRAGQRVKIVR